MAEHAKTAGEHAGRIIRGVGEAAISAAFLTTASALAGYFALRGKAETGPEVEPEAPPQTIQFMKDWNATSQNSPPPPVRHIIEGYVGELAASSHH